MIQVRAITLLTPETIPLPGYKHLPGKNARPDDGLLESIAQNASAVTDNTSYQTNTAWFYGIHLFNNGFYWETHEVLEAVWNNAAPNSREKHLVQGVIQIANAQLKACLGQTNAAARLQKLAGECISRAYGKNDGSNFLLGLESSLMFDAAARCDQIDADIYFQLK